MGTQMLIRPPDSLKQKIQQAAKAEGHTVNALVIQILWAWIRQNPPS